jgi:hypothetical protein
MPVEGGGASSQPQVLRVDGCPDADCNGTFTIQPHKVVNGYARYLKNHSFYYLYKTTTGHWMITWFEVKMRRPLPFCRFLPGSVHRTSACVALPRELHLTRASSSLCVP